MSHYANVVNGIVTQVIVVPDEISTDGHRYLNEECNLSGIWIQTSYNTYAGKHLLNEVPLHKNYAGIGFLWDGFGFAPPPCHAEATLNRETYLWDCLNDFHERKEMNL